MRGLGLLFIVLIGLSSCGESEEKADQRIVFIENGTVFEGFTMKADYDKMMEKDMKMDAEKLDTQLEQIKTFQGDSMSLYQYKKEYFEAQEVYNQKFDELSIKYTAEVNKRLNKYIEEYAKEKGFHMVLGSTGKGNVMYVREKDNVTKDILTYVNKKYTK